MMKGLFKLTKCSDTGLLVLRLTVGLIFIVHGVMKVQMWNMMPSEQMSSGTINLMRLLSIVEPLGGLGLIFGALTQLAAAGLGIIMLGAIWLKMTVFKIGFVGMQGTGWEFDLILLAACVCLFLTGAGKYALDTHIIKNHA